MYIKHFSYYTCSQIFQLKCKYFNFITFIDSIESIDSIC